MADLREFERALKRFAEEEIPEAVAEASRDLATWLLDGVVTRTPVDTGLARANWQVTLGRPATGTVSETDRDGRRTGARGRRVIMRAGPFETIWIVNNLPYVVELEQGSSAKAPAGMVAATLASLDL